MINLPDYFLGFKRSDGRVGVRNHLAIVSTVALTNRWAELISTGSELIISGEFMRGLRSADAALQDRVIQSLVFHPNVGASLVLCHDSTSARMWQDRLDKYKHPGRALALLEQQGMKAAVDSGRASITLLKKMLDNVQRELCSISTLTIALECGGSDTTSAIVTNPAIGRVVDSLVMRIGKAIVSETVEFVGAEDVVRRQCTDSKLASIILSAISESERRMEEDGERYRGVNPTRENIEAGLTTLVEKSMGAVAKIGSSSFSGFLSYGQSPKEPGLYFMDTPFFSPCSMTGMVAGGAQLTLFAMGVFNPSANPIAPTIKICSNPRTVDRWRDALDVDLSDILSSEMNLEDASNQIIASITKVIEGQTTCAEKWNEGQYVIPKSAYPL